jgi:heat shock protein beta-11
MAEVSCATSFDERFDPANVLNSNKNSFWISTGLYPQELTFTFAQAKVVNAVNFQTSGAKKIVIEGC